MFLTFFLVCNPLPNVGIYNRKTSNTTFQNKKKVGEQRFGGRELWLRKTKEPSVVAWLARGLSTAARVGKG